MRHSSPGAAIFLSKKINAKIVNAGDGAHEHPTQALLDAFSINEKLGSIKDKKIVIVGHGRLVGRPLEKIWKNSGYNTTVLDKNSEEISVVTKEADVLVCATGVAGLIKAENIRSNAVVVDAGVATDKNGLVGDVDQSVRDLPDITITPEKGGVGPLTVAALFDNVIRAARESIKTS
jgi:5,10-methylene-tetrahydrofolate dehydrogenase/methenyl tetrahydrofolate cyclohydrolase